MHGYLAPGAPPAGGSGAPIRLPGPDGAVALEGSWLCERGSDLPVGVHLHHPLDQQADGRWPDCAGGQAVAWAGHRPTGHTLLAGDPGHEELLSIGGLIWHRGRGPFADHSPHPGCRGVVRGGRWIPVPIPDTAPPG